MKHGDQFRLEISPHQSKVRKKIRHSEMTMTRRRASPPLCRRKRVAAAPATVPWRYSASPPSPLSALRCRASRSAGRTVSTVPSPRSYRRSAEEWGSNAATTQHHARDTLCSSASEAAGLLLEDYAAGALGRAAA